MEPMSQEALDILRLACADRLAAATRRMRDAQRAYFKDRRMGDLELARYHERTVDALLREFGTLQNEQPGLFDTTGAKR